MPDTSANTAGWGLIAGNGRFPFLVLEGARSQGIEMAVIALKEEAAPELERSAKRLHWVSLGELSKAIDLMHQEGVTQAVMAGQVKHNKIFSAIRPDWKLAKLLFSLPRKNTDALIGAVARVRGRRGYGRHGRNHRAGGTNCRRQAAGGGESQQAGSGHALRCTRDRS